MQATEAAGLRPRVREQHQHPRGRHLTGFKTALTRTVNDHANTHGLVDDLEANLKGEDVREGLTAAVISVKHPTRSSRADARRSSATARSAASSSPPPTTSSGPSSRRIPTPPGKSSTRPRRPRRRARRRRKAEELTRRKSALESTALPGKLAGYQTRDPEEASCSSSRSDSAGSSAKQGRNQEEPGDPPLKGKILNVETPARPDSRKRRIRADHRDRRGNR